MDCGARLSAADPILVKAACTTCGKGDSILPMTDPTAPEDEPRANGPVEEAPRPEQSGSEGTQQPLPGDAKNTLVRIVQPIEPDEGYLGAALGEHSETRSPAVFAFAVAAYRDAELYRAAVMEKWRDAEREKTEYRDRYYEEAKKTAVLQEREKGQSRLQRFQRFSLALGGVVAGSGLSISLIQNSLLNAGGALLVVGLTLLWLGSSLWKGGD